MNRTHLGILTIVVLIATIIGLTIIGLILIARIPSYYLAIIIGLMLYIGVPVFLVVIPAIGIFIWFISTLTAGATIGWAVRRSMTSKGCLIATTAGLVSGGAFVIMVVTFNLLVTIVL